MRPSATILGMSFQWLTMRISEERDRRAKEAAITARLPGALEELYRQLSACVTSYGEAFGPEAAEIQFNPGKIRVTAREERDGRWETTARLEVTVMPSLPGFKVDQGTDEPLLIDIGLLPGEKLYYRNADQYLTADEMTRRILDRTLFPKLKD